jgi:hypothetical protein
MTKNRTIRLLGLVRGGHTSFDGQWLVEYDPNRNGVDPATGAPMACHLVTTPDVRQATLFDLAEAFALYRAIDKRRPGHEPQRWLTAWTVSFDEVRDSARPGPSTCLWSPD